MTKAPGTGNRSGGLLKTDQVMEVRFFKWLATKHT